jgi:hypothetical protein
LVQLYGASEGSIKREEKISQEQFMAYIGLKVAMSFVKLNKVKDYWIDFLFSRKIFRVCFFSG